jgi:hypothetical protein
MQFNEIRLTAAIETAKEKANGNKSLLTAISKAAIGLRGAWIVTELHSSLAITTESGETYFANGVCQCKAFTNGMICKHRVAYRIVALYREMEAAEAAALRCDAIIEDIKAIAEVVATKEAIRIIRSVERDVVSGVAINVVKCGGWYV